MFLLLPYGKRRKLRWQYAHYWSRIRLRRRLLLMMAILGGSAGVLISWASPPVYASRVIMDLRICCHGVSASDFPCVLCEAGEVPTIVTMASRLEEVAAKLGFKKLGLHHAITNFLAH